MKVLLDECVPWPMHKLLSGHDCATAQRKGWGGIKNGDLILLCGTITRDMLLSTYAETPRSAS
jgi:hypothetical protein